MEFINLIIYKEVIDYVKQNEHEEIVEYLTNEILRIIAPTNHEENNTLNPAQISSQKNEEMIPKSNNSETENELKSQISGLKNELQTQQNEYENQKRNLEKQLQIIDKALKFGQNIYL